ncbi:MAG: hypothetical protein ACI4KO_00325, partial [Ruminiclostridium sp.]
MKNNFRDGGLVLSIIALLSTALVMLIFTYSSSLQAFCIFAPILSVTGGFTVAKLISVTRRNFQYFAHIDAEIDHMEKISMNSMPLSVAIIDDENRLVWFNKEFSESFGDEAEYGNSIEMITKLPLEKLLQKEGYEIKYKSCYYKLYPYVPADDDAKEVYI